MKKAPQRVNDMPDFGTDCDILARFIESHWDGTKGLKPKGWDAFYKDYTDFKGIEEWENSAERKRLIARFRSFDDGSACSPSFVDKVALPHVMYDATNQGRNPLRVLMSACVSHGHVRGEIYGAKEAREQTRDGALKGLSRIFGKFKSTSVGRKISGDPELLRAYEELHEFIEQVGRGEHDYREVWARTRS